MKKQLLASIFLLFSTFLIGQVSPEEKQALIDFYIATDGENWSESWNMMAAVDQWQGVTVKDNKVIAVRLLFNNIKGELPESLGDLEHLKILELSFNKISGTLPASLGNLNDLEILAMNGNYISGNIPASYGNLKNLKQLHLSSNKLNGEIPNSIGNMAKLEVFNVFDNDLSGELPAQLAGISSLKEFVVAENNFTNTDQFSVVLLLNTAKLDLKETGEFPSARSVIAIESSDDGN